MKTIRNLAWLGVLMVWGMAAFGQVVQPGGGTSGNATTVNGAAVPASQPCLGSNGSSQLIAGTCSGGGGATIANTTNVIKGDGAGNGIAATPNDIVSGLTGATNGTPAALAVVAGSPSPSTAAAVGAASVFNVLSYGALGNEQLSSNCAITASSSSLVCTGGTFASGDIGKSISIRGAGASAPTTNGSSAASSGGFLPCNKTVYFKITYVNSFGQSVPSSEASQATPACGTFVDTVTVNSPSAGQTATSWRLYASTIAGQETLVSNAGCSSQVGKGCAIGTNWTISAGYNATLGSLGLNTSSTMVGQPPPISSGFTTTIAGYTSATTITLSVAAQTTVTGAQVTWGTDDGPAIQAAINAAAAANGGIVFFPTSAGGYLDLEQITFPIYGTYYQSPIHIEGATPTWQEGDQLTTTIPINYGSVLDLRWDGAVAKIQTLGYGWLGISDMVLADFGDDNNSFLYTTNTQLAVDHNFIFGVSSTASYSHTTDPGAINDFAVLGGTNTAVPDMNPDSAFNGNGTHFEHNSMMRIRRGFTAQYYVSGSYFEHNFEYPGCGNPWGGMDEFYGSLAISADDGNTFIGNNYEIYGSKYRLYASNANTNTFLSEIAFDHNAEADYYVFDGESNSNHIMNFSPANALTTIMLEVGAAQGTNSLTDTEAQQSIWQQRQAWKYNVNFPAFSFTNTSALGGQYGADTVLLTGPPTTGSNYVSIGALPSDKLPGSGLYRHLAALQFKFTPTGSHAQLWTATSGQYPYGLNATPALDCDQNNSCSFTSISSGVFTNTTSGTVTATAGTGVTSVTCATASCTTERGTYTIVGGTATTGAIATLAWPPTTTPWACSTSQNGGSTSLGIGHSVATATGMNITAAVAVTGLTVTVDYICKP